ncbi:helix-turn-helix transcriptional regulator [Bradyrhizobium sp. Leo121]|uniref:AraC family transcriptional regulator n=1 Tax=Bradyrhizobium sp. Leo121 TaxID=1571195 RepID=UPI00102A1BC8|nr:helix-turn-helix transcriptional regulator [Bradyrhizobium sp. Leo121]RZN31708.1 AraC family transcriptional regulator [Bradyrhizobium sp. Leo121]
MPLLKDHADDIVWVEPDDVPRTAVFYGFLSDTIGGFELEPHHHRKSQLLLVQRGALTCEVEGGLFIVPPRSALWIPGGTRHSIVMTGALEGYGAFLAGDVDVRLAGTCCVVSVTPLLRELMIRAAQLPFHYEESGANSRMVSCLLDEIGAAKAEDLHLPMPASQGLRRILNLMMAKPAEHWTLDLLASEVGASPRTFERLIRRETGMGFARWKRQLSVVLAVKWMASGATIQRVAADLGYESTPSFVTMFKKTVGTSPGRYMAERHAARSESDV